MADSPPRVLRIPSVRTLDQTAEVTAADGAVLAVLAPASFRYRFEAADAAGEPLCSGGSRVLSGWQVLAADGAELLTMTGGMFGRYRVTIGERRLLLRGRAYRGDLHVAEGDGSGLPVLQSDPDVRQGRKWVIRTDGSLSLAEVIGIVEVHRLDMRRRRKPAPPRFAMPTPRRLRGL